MLALLLAAPLSADATAKGPAIAFEDGTLTVAGTPRSFHYYATAPCREGSSPCAVIFAFHGGGGQGKPLEKLIHLVETLTQPPWRDRGVLAIFPDGLNKQWNDGRPEINQGVDDVGFVDELIAWSAQHFKTDPAMTFATGISNGGLFSFRLACDRALRFRAVAPVAANLGAVLATTCQPARPVGMLHVMGTKDPLVPYEGGGIQVPVVGWKDRGQVLSAVATDQFWERVDQCTQFDEKVYADEHIDRTALHVKTGVGCAGAPLVEWTVVGGGHTWPGGAQYMRPILVGVASQQRSATNEILHFFLDPAP